MVGNTRLLVSSYSYKWSMGFRKYTPREPKSLQWFVEQASRLGLDGVQIADNLEPEKLDDNECRDLKRVADSVGVALQWGFDGWEPQKVRRLATICERTDSRLLRGVFGTSIIRRFLTTSDAVRYCRQEIEDLIPTLEANELTLAIENHFDFTLDELVGIIETVNHPLVRICLDTTNATGQFVSPLSTVQQLAPLSVAMHFKDMAVSKIVGGYTLLGTAVGAGSIDCGRILETSLTINPDLEVCIELGTPQPEVDPPYDAYETEQVERSVAETKRLLEEYYRGSRGGRSKP